MFSSKFVFIKKYHMERNAQNITNIVYVLSYISIVRM